MNTATPRMEIERLEILAGHLENQVRPESFDMSDWFEEDPKRPCGFAACVLGHACLIHKFREEGLSLNGDDVVLKTAGGTYYAGQAGRLFFGLTFAQKDDLFYTSGYPGVDWRDITPAMTAAKIRRMIAEEKARGMRSCRNGVTFYDADVLNPDDCPAVGVGCDNYKGYLIHDYGTTVCVVFAENENDALDLAADEGKLAGYEIDEDREKDYDMATGEGVTLLGSDSKPHDIQLLSVEELPPVKFSYCALFNAEVKK